MANLLIVSLFPNAAAAAAAAVLSPSGQLGSPSVVNSTQLLALALVGLAVPVPIILGVPTMH